MDYRKCLDGKIQRARKLITRLHKIHSGLNNLSDFIRDELKYMYLHSNSMAHHNQLQDNLRHARVKLEKRLIELEHKYKEKYGHVPVYKDDAQ